MNRTNRYTIFLFLTILLINFSTSFFFTVIGRTYELSILGRVLMMGLAAMTGAAIVTLLVISTAPVLKNYLTTFRQLVRLDTFSHPLLIKLQQTAPSTFQHSIQVANLAHRAAKAIGADAFLSRIGGYYHDIGKIHDADFFIENRRHGNPEPPKESPKALFKKIQSHIKQGIKLAKEYKLPAEVIAFIPEHHGTLLAQMPYAEAKAKDATVAKSDFRYRGPKPLSKETALVMLADAIESKMRTVEELSPENMTEVVDSIITARQKDHQLDLSGLTKHELELIRLAFIEEAQVLYHQRIKYPEAK